MCAKIFTGIYLKLLMNDKAHNIPCLTEDYEIPDFAL